MMLRMVVRDCLYLNWALPAAAVPEPPAPLRYQRHPWNGRDYIFASVLLFHQDAIRLAALPLPRLGYPQLNARFYVLDGEGVPGVLLHTMLMPAWVAPGVRLVARQPAAGASLDFPRPSRDAEAPCWRWRAQRHGTLTVRAWVDSPAVGEGPRLGTWEETVRYFQDRPRGYAVCAGGLRRIDVSHPTAPVWPLRAELGGDGLLRRLLPFAGPETDGGSAAWPALHSTWLTPEMPFSFALDLVPSVPVVQHLPHPAAGRVASPVLRSDALLTGGAESGPQAVLASAA
jgi:Uncharacterized conserved protein (COG2071)